MVSTGAGALLNAAILGGRRSPLASRPLLRRNLGDSWNLKTKYRAKKTTKVMAPITITSYRQPILLATEQQASPSLTARQEGSSHVASVLASGAVGDGGPHDHLIGCHMLNRTRARDGSGARTRGQS